MQQNWIGKSQGCEIDFTIHGEDRKINVFTTRPDTIFGASFLALSVDHPLSQNFKSDEKFNEFKLLCNKTGTTEESLANADKIGFNTNLFVNHPFIEKKIASLFLQILYLWIMGQVQYLVVLLMIKDFDFAKNTN